MNRSTFPSNGNGGNENDDDFCDLFDIADNGADDGGEDNSRCVANTNGGSRVQSTSHAALNSSSSSSDGVLQTPEEAIHSTRADDAVPSSSSSSGFSAAFGSAFGQVENNPTSIGKAPNHSLSTSIPYRLKGGASSHSSPSSSMSFAKFLLLEGSAEDSSSWFTFHCVVISLSRSMSTSNNKAYKALTLGTFETTVKLTLYCFGSAYSARCNSGDVVLVTCSQPPRKKQVGSSYYYESSISSSRDLSVIGQSRDFGTCKKKKVTKKSSGICGNIVDVRVGRDCAQCRKASQHNKRPQSHSNAVARAFQDKKFFSSIAPSRGTSLNRVGQVVSKKQGVGFSRGPLSSNFVNTKFGSSFPPPPPPPHPPSKTSISSSSTSSCKYFSSSGVASFAKSNPENVGATPMNSNNNNNDNDNNNNNNKVDVLGKALRISSSIRKRGPASILRNKRKLSSSSLSVNSSGDKKKGNYDKKRKKKIIINRDDPSAYDGSVKIPRSANDGRYRPPNLSAISKDGLSRGKLDAGALDDARRGNLLEKQRLLKSSLALARNNNSRGLSSNIAGGLSAKGKQRAHQSNDSFHESFKSVVPPAKCSGGGATVSLYKETLDEYKKLHRSKMLDDLEMKQLSSGADVTSSSSRYKFTLKYKCLMCNVSVGKASALADCVANGHQIVKDKSIVDGGRSGKGNRFSGNGLVCGVGIEWNGNSVKHGRY